MPVPCPFRYVTTITAVTAGSTCPPLMFIVAKTPIAKTSS